MDLKYLKNVAFYLLSAALSLLFIWYIVYQAAGGFETPVETFPAEPATSRSTITLDAYIMRAETILYSASQGAVSYLYNDGEKVKIDSVVANVYPGAGGGADARVTEIDKKISILEKSSTEGGAALSDTTVIDSRISALYNTIRYKVETGDIDYALRKKDELLALMNRRQLIVKNSADFGDKIQVLEDEKTALTALLYGGAEAEPVITPTPGYFYSEIDGYEEIFAGSRAALMTLDDFEKMRESSPDEGLRLGARGSAIGKIATDYKWYIACEIKREQLKSFAQGYSYTVIFPYSGDVEIKMKLYQIVAKSGDDRVVLVFESGTLLEGFNFLRRQTVEIVEANYSGYRVPVSSVRIVDGRQGVYTLKGNIIKFKEIVPLAESDGYFIVETQDKINDPDYAGKVALYDLVVVKGKDLYDGKIID